MPEPLRVEPEVDRLRMALRRACDDAFADIEAAMRRYIEEVTTHER